MPTVLESLGPRGFKAQDIRPEPMSQHLSVKEMHMSSAELWFFTENYASAALPCRPCLHSPLGKSAAFKWWHTDAVGLDFFNLVLLKNFSIYLLGLPASAACPSISDLSRITVGLQPSYFAKICLPSFLNLHIGPHIMRVVLIVAFHFCYIPESLPVALKAESHIQGAFRWIYQNLFWDPTLPRILIDLRATPKRLFSIQNIFTPSVGSHFFLALIVLNFVLKN